MEQVLPDGSTKKWHSMGLLWEFAEQIADFRKGNGLPRATAKEVVHDIEEQTCERLHGDREWCVDAEAKKKGPRPSLSGPLRSAARVAAGARVLIDWLGDGGKPVPIAVAQARANVCRKCPENKDGHSWLKLTADTVRAIAEQMQAKAGLKLRVEHEEELHTCAVCGCVTTLKVHVPLETILAHTDDETLNCFPAACWIPTERRSL